MEYPLIRDRIFMTANNVLAELKRLGDPRIKALLLRHGAKEPFFGVKIEKLKFLQRRIGRNHPLALELFETGNSDAMYLAGLVCDPSAMQKADLQRWALKAYWYMLNEYIVPWTTAESRYGRELAMEWIDSKKEKVAATGWTSYSSLLAITPDDALDMKEIQSLLARIVKEIHAAPNRVRHTMNSFVISVGTYVAPLLEAARSAAARIGVVMVEKDGAAGMLPDAAGAIEKVAKMGRTGKKRKTAFC